ncbi:SGT1-domain-containing protein [Sistotremastrum niveocremeum HHB9708]|uniref:SGT1-domain-containing protein n=1 Tax=Sistotremastrum niveocremeum HHB9708 TaxID=1314777 RepID=A0A164XN51_9AGAM|nr:SGT1-domain-containing protein [Sistotremastrum niveocremeum HHB9708]
MDIFNKPPQIGEDTIQYTLYPPANQSGKEDVESLATLILSSVADLFPNHLWNRDSFDFTPAQDPDSPKGQTRWLLEGRMRVGDCVDDEWLVVWLLREISKHWDVAISVFDSDGEFLLIEAADELPGWVTPTNSENRVWIYKSKFHLIPISFVSPPGSVHRRRKLPGAGDSDDEADTNEEDTLISVSDALKFLRDPMTNTEASPEIQAALERRIKGYPAYQRQHVHFTRVHVPIDVARALSVNPGLVQRAAEAFYTRDAIQLRAVHRMSRFPPSPAVTTTIKITRTAYAQMVGQKFHSPKIFGRWMEGTREASKEWRWRDIGMKIACGFEILYQESKNKKKEGIAPSDAPDALRDALSRDPEYPKYLSNLTKAGYFGSELQGSQKWKEREDRAAAMFVDMHRKDDVTRISFAELVNSALATAPKESFSPSNEPEDDDQWLNVDAADFEAMLQKNAPKSDKAEDAMDVDDQAGQSNTKVTEEDRLAQEQTAKLQSLAEKVSSFVEGKGALEGAKFDDDILSEDDEPMEEMTDEDFSDSESEEPESTNADRQAALERLVPGIDPKDYGQMPASYHSNSQKVKKPSEDGTKAPEKEKLPEPTPKPLRRPLLPRDDFDGVDSDDETDSEEERLNALGTREGEDDESDEDRPQIVGEIEVDMEEEQAEFLKFSREALGITDDMWKDILQERKGRGAFVPEGVNIASVGGYVPEVTKPEQTKTLGDPPPPARNPNLDTFESVMQAMDEELAKTRAARGAAPPKTSSKGKGKGKATVEDDDGQDLEAAMDAELAASLEKGSDDEDSDEEGSANASVDYNLIKNFLESFKSQAGQSGPVSNLVGRLQPGWQLPRDEK